MRRPRDLKAEAAAWFDSLGRAVTTADLGAFWDWRADPKNDAAYQVVEREGLRIRGRFVAMSDPRGFSVMDTWTGEPASFANVRPAGVSLEAPGREPAI